MKLLKNSKLLLMYNVAIYLIIVVGYIAVYERILENSKNISNIKFAVDANGDIETLKKITLGIAVLAMLNIISCVDFFVTKRKNELFARRMSGASVINIYIQFLIEYIFVEIISAVISVVLLLVYGIFEKKIIGIMGITFIISTSIGYIVIVIRSSFYLKKSISEMRK